MTCRLRLSTLALLTILTPSACGGEEGAEARATPVTPEPAPEQPPEPPPEPDAPEDSGDWEPRHTEPVEMPEGLGLDTPLHDPSGHALDAFHAALRRAEAGVGKARVLIYGASHTACDHYPGYLREHLQHRFGDAGRGFTLPAWPSERYHYWQWGAEVEEGEGWERVRLGVDRGQPDQYGFAGIVFDSNGGEAVARVSTNERGVGSRAQRVEVLYLAQPGGGLLEVRIDDELVDTIDTAADEVAAGFSEYEVEDGPHGVELRALAGAPVRLYGVIFERDHAGVVVDNLALSGARARNHLKWIEPTYGQHLAHRDPDLIITFYGGNEGNDFGLSVNRYARNAERALEKLREAAPDASCLLLGPADKPVVEDEGTFSHRGRTTAINRVQRELAERHGCAFFDTVAFMGGPLSMVRWVEADPPLARDDYVHFSAPGYRRMAEVLLDGLLEGYQ